MSAFEAVFFDFDGVLVDSEPIHFAAWQEALAPFGVSVPWDPYYHRFMGLEDRAAIRMLAEELNPPRTLEELWPAFAEKQRIFSRRIHAAPQVPPSTRAVIALLREAGYKLAVVTSSSGAEVRPLLESNGVYTHMDACVYAEDVRHKKPDPEPYLTAKARLGVQRALVLEDSPAGMASARAAGCEVLTVTEVGAVGKLLCAALGLSGEGCS
ncbi:MAG: HAD family phosphatase [Bryobacterales bacterium]|nr:HAD family phosphatase [Bryobacterales bacterium]